MLLAPGFNHHIEVIFGIVLPVFGGELSDKFIHGQGMMLDRLAQNSLFEMYVFAP